MPELQIPTIDPRPYQIPAFRAFDEGKTRLGLSWPRRAGKDSVSLQLLAKGALQRVANYWHLLPEANQCER